MDRRPGDKRARGEGAQAVVDEMLSARTTEEVHAAKARAKAWLKDHPDDAPLIMSAGEQLEMVARSLKKS